MTAGIIIDIDRFAELSAQLDDPFLPRPSTLAKAGLSDAEYDVALKHWRERMAADTAEDGVGPRFASAYSNTREQLARSRRGDIAAADSADAARFLGTEAQSFRHEAAKVSLHAPIESLSPASPEGEALLSTLPSTPPSFAPSVPPTEAPVAPAEARPPIALPSYLRVEPPRTASPWIVATPTPVLITHSAPASPPASQRPPIRFEDVNATSDALPSLRDEPLPFGDKPSPGFVAAMSTPAVAKDPSGETVMIPALRDEPDRPLPFMAKASPIAAPPKKEALAAAPPAKPVPTFTVEQYASLSAELSVAPEKTAATLSRYGIADPSTRQELERVWAARFASEPALHRQWSTLVDQYRAWLASKR